MIVSDLVIRSVQPDWLKHRIPYQRHGIDADKDGSSGGSTRNRSFFGKYGLYIMIFIGVALARGIRKGLAELHEELQREEAAKNQPKRPTGQLKIQVAKKKTSLRNRKKAAVVASS